MEEMGGGEGKGEEERREMKMSRCPKVKMLMERTKVVGGGGGGRWSCEKDETRRDEKRGTWEENPPTQIRSVVSPQTPPTHGAKGRRTLAKREDSRAA
jgi:hypothetical protein